MNSFRNKSYSGIMLTVSYTLNKTHSEEREGWEQKRIKMTECKGNVSKMFDVNKSVVKLLELFPSIHPTLPPVLPLSFCRSIRPSVHLLVGQLVGWLVSQSVKSSHELVGQVD